MNHHSQKTRRMNVPRIASWCTLAALLALAVALGRSNATAPQRNPPGAEKATEVLAAEPQGAPQGAAKGSLPGGSNDKSQDAPQKKSNHESKNNHQQ
jgi:hypothetical protein